MYELNPLLSSRLLLLIRRRKNYLHVRDDMSCEARHALLRRMNQEIIDVLDRGLKLLGVPLVPRRQKGYKVRRAVDVPGTPRRGTPGA